MTVTVAEENAIWILNSGDLTHHVLMLVLVGAAVWSASWCACCGCYLAAGMLGQSRKRRQAEDWVEAEARRGLREIEIYLGAAPDQGPAGRRHDPRRDPGTRRGQRRSFRRERGGRP